MTVFRNIPKNKIGYVFLDGIIHFRLEVSNVNCSCKVGDDIIISTDKLIDGVRYQQEFKCRVFGIKLKDSCTSYVYARELINSVATV